MQVPISSESPLPKLFEIEWGSSQEKAMQRMRDVEGAVYIEEQSGDKNLVFAGGLFANKDVKMWVLQFYEKGLHTAKILIEPPQQTLNREFRDLIARFTREYGSPVSQSTEVKKLYSFGSNGEVEGSILIQVAESQILITYQHQRLNTDAMSQMSGLDAPVKGMPNTSQQGASDCFVATAATGSCNHPKVVLLKQFRDDVLLRSEFGSLLVRIYYAISPPIASVIKKSAGLQWATRKIIVQPAAWASKHFLDTGPHNKSL